MRIHSAPIVLLVALCFACGDNFLENDQDIIPIPVVTETIQGDAVIKTIPVSTGWITFQETIQPQFMITVPKRKIVWLNPDLSLLTSYSPSGDWSLIDMVVHPNGETSVVLVRVDFPVNYKFEMKLIHVTRGGQIIEKVLEPLPSIGPETVGTPVSLDRVKLAVYNDDVFVVARWKFNEVHAYRYRFESGQFNLRWTQYIEPKHYAGSIGIIGGGYDNFHQGDRYLFVYADVDRFGNLYAGVPATEELLENHDQYFNENTMADADPSTYDFGVILLTKVSPEGQRQYSTIVGHSTKKRILNMKVIGDIVYLIGRVKINSEPNGWDAWLLGFDSGSKQVAFDRGIHFTNGDMFWDIDQLSDGRLIGVGSTDYIQNPAGLSVSDSRKAFCALLNEQGELLTTMEMPQGPSVRGSEAMSVITIDDMAIISGIHNAPGTHAEVFSDGFFASRNIPEDN